MGETASAVAPGSRGVVMGQRGLLARLVREDERGAMAIEFGMGVLLIALITFALLAVAGVEIAEVFPNIDLPSLSLGI